MINLGDWLYACELEMDSALLDVVCCKCQLGQVGWLPFHISCLRKLYFRNFISIALYVFLSYSIISTSVIPILYHLAQNVSPLYHYCLLSHNMPCCCSLNVQREFHTWALAFLISHLECSFLLACSNPLSASGPFSNAISK